MEVKIPYPPGCKVHQHLGIPWQEWGVYVGRVRLGLATHTYGVSTPGLERERLKNVEKVKKN